jgi:hypothetical protein
MSPEKTKLLLTKYPEIFQEPFGFECSDGWFDLIDRLCQKLISLTPPGELHPLATQVKEKFAGLRFYVDGATSDQQDAIDGAENESLGICEECGEPGKVRKNRWWIYTACDKHVLPDEKK